VCRKVCSGVQCGEAVVWCEVCAEVVVQCGGGATCVCGGVVGNRGMNVLGQVNKM